MLYLCICKLHFAKEGRLVKSLYMSNKIRHEGVIEAIEEGCIHVRIRQSSACAACKVAAHCNASETKEKRIDVYDVHSGRYQVGQVVTLATTPRIGLMASLYAYAIPLVLMVATIILVVVATGDEIKAACAGMLVLLPYYFLIYMLRGKIRGHVFFEIEDKQ